MRNEKNRPTGHGQSLFEVMFAVAIASMIMISVVSLSKQTISSSDFSGNNALANKYALEATEWIRGERDNDWVSFHNKAAANPTFCLDNLSWGGGFPPCPIMPGTNIFRRQATLSRIDLDGDIGNGNESVEMQVIVTWEDGKGMHQVKNITRYTNWNI